MTNRNFHESYTEHETVKGPTDRNFGFTVGGILAAIGLIKIAFFAASWFAFVLLGAGSTLIALAALRPVWLARPNAWWMKLGLLLFHVVNPIVLAILFAVCFVPAGLIMRLRGYDPLRREFEPEARSYWIEKDKTDIENPMKYQF